MNTKDNLLKLNAVVIGEADYKEYDKLLTLLTKEIGKVKVYAFNVRKANSKNIGKVRLFTFGTYEVRQIGDRYQLENIVLKKSFDELTCDYGNTCLALYFVELANYFGFENLDDEEIYNLLYYSFKAIVDGKVPLKLILRVYELKMLQYQGEYKESDKLLSDNATLRYTWDYIINSLPQKLYTFRLSEEIFDLFDKEMSIEMRDKVGKKFKSYEEVKNIL